MPGVHSPGDFSLVRGGPFHDGLCALQLVRFDKRDVMRQTLAWWLLTWLPVVILELFRLGPGGLSRGVLYDFSLHARLLLATPLLFVADEVLHRLGRRSVAVFVAGDFVPNEQNDRLLATIDQAVRRRDSRWAEASLLAIAVLAQAAASLATGKLGPVVGRMSHELSPALLWLTFVGLPLCNFLLLRSLYRWSIWACVLWRFSQLDLRTVPTHPDLAGGLGHLSEPVLGFAVVLTSANVAIGAAWADRIVFGGQSFKSFADEFAALALLGELLAFLPLMPLSGRLLHARLQGLVDYGVLALAYTRQFHERWITSGDRQDLLGTSDIQSLADLANSYEIVTKMRIVPFAPRQMLVVLVSMALPMLPLVATEIPISALLASAGRALLGGLPP